MSADVTPIDRVEGDEHFHKLLRLDRELDELLGDMPCAELGYPLRDPATCQELREAVSALQRAVDLLTQAYGRENPRYDAISEQKGATVN